jgi:hypothetical protein
VSQVWNAIADSVEPAGTVEVGHEHLRAAVRQTMFQGIVAEERGQRNGDRSGRKRANVRDCRFRRLTEHDSHSIALLDAEAMERVGEPVCALTNIAEGVAAQRAVSLDEQERLRA